MTPSQLTDLGNAYYAGKNGKKKDFAAAATYGEIKKWFIEQFPELEIKRKTIDEILGNTAA